MRPTKTIMKLDIETALLFIEPKETRSQEPIVDRITIKMFNLIMKNLENRGVAGSRGFTTGLATMGVHTCICGAHSTSCDYMINNTIATNSLCVHYLAYHRDEVPQSHIDVIETLDASDELDEKDHDMLKKVLQ